MEVQLYRSFEVEVADSDSHPYTWFLTWACLLWTLVTFPCAVAWLAFKAGQGLSRQVTAAWLKATGAGLQSGPGREPPQRELRPSLNQDERHGSQAHPTSRRSRTSRPIRQCHKTPETEGKGQLQGGAPAQLQHGTCWWQGDGRKPIPAAASAGSGAHHTPLSWRAPWRAPTVARGYGVNQGGRRSTPLEVLIGRLQNLARLRRKTANVVKLVLGKVPSLSRAHWFLPGQVWAWLAKIDDEAQGKTERGAEGVFLLGSWTRRFKTWRRASTRTPTRRPRPRRSGTWKLWPAR